MEVFPLQIVDWLAEIEYLLNVVYILVTFCNKHFTFREEIHQQGHDAGVEETIWSNRKNANDFV